MIRLIAALDEARGIGKNGGQPWNIPHDEAHFEQLTRQYGGNVLVAKKTFDIIGIVLPGRTNYVVTHGTEPIKGVTTVNDLPNFLQNFTDDLWVIGGAGLYEQVMDLGYADELVLTHIAADFGCSHTFPEYDDYELVERSETQAQNGFSFYYATYRKRTT